MNEREQHIVVTTPHTRKMYAAAAIWWLEQKKKKSTILARNSNKKIKLYYASGTWYANRRRKIKENFRWKPFCDGPHQTWEILIFIFPHTICSNDAWFKPFCSTRAFMWISCILRRVCEVSCFCSTQRRHRRTSTHFMLNEKSKCGKLSMPSYVAGMWPLDAAISATGSRVKMKRNRPRKNWLDGRKFCMAAHENFQYDDRRVCVWCGAPNKPTPRKIEFFMGNTDRILWMGNEKSSRRWRRQFMEAQIWLTWIKSPTKFGLKKHTKNTFSISVWTRQIYTRTSIRLAAERLNILHFDSFVNNRNDFAAATLRWEFPERITQRAAAAAATHLLSFALVLTHLHVNAGAKRTA